MERLLNQPVDIQKYRNQEVKKSNLLTFGNLALALQPQESVRIISFPVRGSLNASIRISKEFEKSIQVVGFSLMDEVNAFKRNYQKGLEQGKSRWEAFEDAWKEDEENLKTWKREYVHGDNVFVGHYLLGEFDGQKRILDQSGFPVADKIKSQERKGQVLKSWLEGEKGLINGKEVDMWIVISPEGPTGLPDPNNKNALIDFPETYVQVAIRQDREIKFVTFRTNLNIPESRRLLIKLVNTFNSETTMPHFGSSILDEVSNIIGTGIYISSDHSRLKDNALMQLAQQITSVKENAFGEKSLDQIQAQLENAENNFRLDSICQGYLDELKKCMYDQKEYLDNDFVLRRIEKEIQKTVIKIMLSAKGRSATGANGSLSEHDIKWGLQQMQSFKGCAGSGSKSKSIYTFLEGLGIPRLGISALEENDWHLGTCEKCGIKSLVGGCNICKSCE